MTLDEITSDLAAFTAARDAILTRGAKSYAVAGRQFTALDLEYIDKKITDLRTARDRASAGGMFFAAQNRRPE